MIDPPILVTGATGKTGSLVIRQLRAQGVAVRAFVHRIDQRSAALESLGCEVVEGDFLEIASMRRAMNGVRRVYFCHPPTAGLLAASVTAGAVARDARVEVLANLSQITARADARNSFKRALTNAGLSGNLATHLAAVAIDHQEGWFRAENDVVASLTGREPETLPEFVRRHAATFGQRERSKATASASIVTERSSG